MEEKKQLIVPFDKKTFMQCMIIMPSMIIVIQLLLYIIPNINVRIFSWASFLELLILLLVKSFLYFATGIFTIVLVYAIFCILQNKPKAILDEDGIRISHMSANESILSFASQYIKIKQ